MTNTKLRENSVQSAAARWQLPPATRYVNLLRMNFKRWLHFLFSAADFDEVMTTSTTLDGVNSVISSNFSLDFPKEVRVGSDDTEHVNHITFTDGPCKLQL